MITSEPWSSMQRLTKTNKTTLQSERTSALKKDLTGPTLLEISGNRVYQALTRFLSGIFVCSSGAGLTEMPTSYYVDFAKPQIWDAIT